MKHAITLYFLVSLLICPAFVGCRAGDKSDAEDGHAFGIKPGTPILFIIPDHFRGKILITEDRAHGVEAPIVDGKVTVRIPSSGKTALKNWSPLFNEHQESASYSDGTPVADPNMVPSGQELSADTVYFWDIATVKGSDYPQETLIYFIGTKSERDKL